MASIGGSIDAWCPAKDQHPLPNWEVYQGHETPFSAMTYLLRIWPGRLRTYECPEEERHRRIMELISGYPMIREGKRPLDEPLNPDAQLSFTLTVFFDKILPSINQTSDWHSLATLVLHNDLIFEQTDEGQNRDKNYDQLQHSIMRYIRERSTYGEDAKKYSRTSLHTDEIRFLTEAHSQHEQVTKYWPNMEAEDEKLIWKEMDARAGFYVNVTNHKKLKNFLPHTVKFGKIQTWISDWGLPEDGTTSMNKWLSESTAQKMVIGASTFLDATGSALRTQILQEKRPGSIIIDGGGRISYLSTNSFDNEKSFLRKVLQQSLTREHLNSHPYRDAIELAAEKYLKLLPPHLSQLGISEKEFNLMKNKAGKPRKKFFDHFTDDDNAAFFLPKIYYSGEKLEHEDIHNFPSLIQSVKTPKQCELCCLCQNTPNPNKVQNSPKNVMEKGKQYVCFFHFLLFELGTLFQLRQKGNPAFNDAKNVLRQGPFPVRHLVKFDGNSIGSLFMDFKYTTKQNELPPSTNLFIEDIEDIFLPLELPPEIRMENENEPNVRTDVMTLRHSALIKRQRRSTLFNTTWWQSMYESLEACSVKNLVPWILAGDDVLLANKSAELSPEDIRDWLFKFVDVMIEKMPNKFPISIAGACYERKHSETIISMYKEVSKLEEMASYIWKDLHHKKGGGYLTGEKLEKLELFRKNELEAMKVINAWLEESPENYRNHANHMSSLFLLSDYQSD